MTQQSSETRLFVSEATLSSTPLDESLSLVGFSGNDEGLPETDFFPLFTCSYTMTGIALSSHSVKWRS